MRRLCNSLVFCLICLQRDWAIAFEVANHKKERDAGVEADFVGPILHILGVVSCPDRKPPGNRPQPIGRARHPDRGIAPKH